MTIEKKFYYEELIKINPEELIGYCVRFPEMLLEKETSTSIKEIIINNYIRNYTENLFLHKEKVINIDKTVLTWNQAEQKYFLYVHYEEMLIAIKKENEI